jgi:hypothetical protein
MAQAASGYVSQDTAPPPPSLRPHTQRGGEGEGRKFRARMEEGRVET